MLAFIVLLAILFILLLISNYPAGSQEKYLRFSIRWCNKFMKHLSKKYLRPDKKQDARFTSVVQLLNVFNNNRIQENKNPSDPSKLAFTRGKGKIIKLCLRRTENVSEEEFLSLIKHVILHELAHVITISQGHTLEFWQKFKFLIDEAESAGLYVPADYKKKPIKYCNLLDVSYNPAFDNNLISYK